MYDYRTYDNAATHVRTNLGVDGSSYKNDTSVDPGLERPHLLGPGNHFSSSSGLHLPSIDVAAPTSQMRHASYGSGSPVPPIVGTSFAAPSILSIAIQAHQYEGFFSALAYPMVNKAVLMASTRDANNDGAIGKSTVWSLNAPTVDAEDGAGQIKIDALKSILDSNQYFSADLNDAAFSSCGTNCRKMVVTTFTVAPGVKTRVALAWQACLEAEGSTPVITNDLDLALNCGSPIVVCGGTMLSNSVTSELALERPGCSYQRSCGVEIRIKNGASLLACGTGSSTERVGVAWSFNN